MSKIGKVLVQITSNNTMSTNPTATAAVTIAESLESKLNVLRCIYVKYRQLFESLFGYMGYDLVLVSAGSNRFHLNLSSNDALVDLSDLFELGWRLFALVKDCYPQVSNDLVGCYHLMLCSVNFLVENVVVVCGEQNDSQTKNPADFLDALCRDSSQVECLRVKTINQHYFRPELTRHLEISQFSLKCDTRKLVEKLAGINSSVDDFCCLNSSRLVEEIDRISPEVMIETPSSISNAIASPLPADFAQLVTNFTSLIEKECQNDDFDLKVC